MARSHRQSVRITSSHATALFVLLLLVVATTRPASAEIPPRGQRMANDVKYGDWRKVCFKPGGAKTVCRTSITGTFDTGQTAVRLDLIEREGDHTARLQMFVPVGMYVRVPVKLRVDQGNTYAVPYTWCLNNACIAADVAKPGLIREMETGKTLALEVVDPNLLSVTALLPLAQFVSAHKGPPAQTFDQQIDE
ncbi:invasion associated locus B family protein [Bradyrhizobium sp. cf659]|uniref:invasion associated locus B family protein n=1 Tax=Bradyrhizobium sp. cf659 TaxID=1761771 RepID=UPI0008EB7729|nr:invasion associated locus B family protein [Bradyrhizobium sp. cf659]SFI31541.1 Invasion protein IalB, involved in pathogenesis [Bradyrhizobium sp. cf659]